MKLITLLALCLIPGLVAAGERSSPSDSKTPPVSMPVKADYAEFTVTITTDQEVVDYQLYELSSARKQLIDTIQKNPALKAVVETPQIDLHQYSKINLASSGGGSSATAVSLQYALPDQADLLGISREV